MADSLYYHIKLELGDSEYRLSIQERPQNSYDSLWFVEARQRQRRNDVDDKVRSFLISDADSATLRRSLDLNKFIVSVIAILEMESWDVNML